MAAILKIKDANGNWVDIPAIVGPQGPKGEDGSINFEDLTPEQKESLKGADGFSPLITSVPKADGSGYTLFITDASDDTQQIEINNGQDGAQGPAGPQGEQGPKGDPGSNYTITTADYSAIADVVLSKMTNAEGVKY